MKPSRLPAFLLLSIVLSLALPRVNPPRAAFHRHKSPVALNTQSPADVTVASIGAAFKLTSFTELSEGRRERPSVSAPASYTWQPLLHRFLRC
jgi:hypothetical protein